MRTKEKIFSRKGNVFKELLLSAVVSAIISSIVSFGMWMVQEKVNKQAQNESTARQIRTTIINDLYITIPLTKGIEEGIGKNQLFEKMPYGFKMLYHPMAILPPDNFGMLPDSILSYIDEYQRSISQCSKIHDDYITLIESSASLKQLEGYLINYDVCLDSVIRHGINVIKEIDKYYSKLDKLNKQLPPYISIDEFKNEIGGFYKTMGVNPPVFN